MFRANSTANLPEGIDFGSFCLWKLHRIIGPRYASSRRVIYNGARFETGLSRVRINSLKIDDGRSIACKVLSILLSSVRGWQVEG